MATNYMTLKIEEVESKKTEFKTIIDSEFDVTVAGESPEEYANVLYIGHDRYYGDVFKAWNSDENNFSILFGVAGDEFKK